LRCRLKGRVFNLSRNGKLTSFAKRTSENTQAITESLNATRNVGVTAFAVASF
jgi:hypothetical protein